MARQLSNAENFDRAILTYSTAGLGLSLAFLKDFLPITEAGYAWLLYGSWGMFTLAITITICSYISSQRGITRQLVLGERYYMRRDEAAVTEKNLFVAMTDWLNNVSGLCFIAAIIFTTAFVSINLERASTMAEQKRVFTQDGAPVPTLQKFEQTGNLQRGAPIPALQQIPQQQAPQQQAPQQQPTQSSAPEGGDKK